MIRPRHATRRQTIIAVVIIVLAMIVGLGIILTRQLGFTQPNVPTPSITPGHVTLTGTIVCLPHKNTKGPQTLECAFGLQSTTGEYYGLRHLNQDQLVDGTLSVSTRVQVSGKLKAPDDTETYGIVGNIDVESIEVISSAASRLDIFDQTTTINL